MQVHQEELSDVTRYIENNVHIKLEDKQGDYDQIMGVISKYKQIDAATEFLEIGTGLGWFPTMRKLNGGRCKGIEISSQLVEHGKAFGREHGIVADIELGNIEDTDIGESRYDVIIAASVFEHIQHWQDAIKKVFVALKPGGLFYFDSTNKFSFTSGEFNFPLYGWLPDQWRYRLRIARQGEDIMKLGIDFNQFTYGLLRRNFKQVGFRTVLDRIDIRDPENLSKPWKRAVLRGLKHAGPIKMLPLTFSSGTLFVCIK